MNTKLGAHEVMEVHEVLTDTIDGINQFQLYRPHVQDPQLATILNNQIQFLIREYNNMVQAVNQHGGAEAIPYRKPSDNFSPTYGLDNPSPQSPNTSINQMNDRDVASGMLGCQKSTATLRMAASLECADPQIRRIMQQGAVNSSEQAYEVWQYMNQKGYYQVPTLKDVTTSTMVNTYTPAATATDRTPGHIQQ
ncbi:MAG: spore coat protein [Bacillaceae bacterium]|nr:spore coat protein [Bacillaceae bacterium]